MRLLFKGGTVVTGKGPRRADVLVGDEKILDVCRDIPAIGAQVVDVTGMLLFPGFIDAHTHFDLDVCNTTTADDFASGSRAALRGGTTTIIDFACPNKGETLHDGLRLWHKKADGKCACDYGFHMTIDDWNETIEREIDDMYAEGISSFKMYMTYPAMMIGDEAMYKALKKLKEKGGICGVHCENAGVIDALIAEKKAAGENGVHCHPETRPDIMEAEAVGRLLRIAEQVDVPVVIVHTTNIEALDEIANARWRGQKVFVETCPQYLVLDDSVYYNEDWLQAAKYVCSPPIRKPADREALWRAIRRGEVQTVSTDHCSFTTQQKLAGHLPRHSRRHPRRGDAGRADLHLRRGQKEDRSGCHVPCAGREPRQAVWPVPAQRRTGPRLRRRYRGVRPRGRPRHPRRGYGGRGGLQPL